jgi:protein-export membrane protein SecD
VSLRTRAIASGLLLVLMIWAAVPSFFSEQERLASPWLSDQAMNLGLDLRGGVHWLLRVDEPVAYTQELKHFGGLIQEAAEEDRLELKSQPHVRDDQVLELQGDVGRLRKLVDDRIGSTAVEVAQTDGRLELRLAEGWKDDVLDRAVSQAIEVLEDRVNKLGVREPIIAPQGTGRILVQMPGGDIDPAQARQVLENTTFLEFKRVLAAAPNEELLRANYPDGLPPETQIVVSREDPADKQKVTEALLVPKDPVLTGDMLQDARVGFDRRNRPEIQFTWDGTGAQIFREFTGENVGQRMAAIIDNVAVTAPTIQDRIGRSGVITGSFTLDEAKMVAVSLRSGALPIPLQIEEERSVGPALGRDSIFQGLRSLLVGGAAVFVFMVAYYSTSGWFANVTQLVNLIVIVGLMSMAGATLTLPGIAGLVLTVGMAVDANVLIYERIREELRKGASARNAVAIGFSRAAVTIWDSNLTTLIAAIILLYLGAGPVKGFGVTLAIGLVSTVFCALVVTRLMVEWAVRRNPDHLRI